MKKVAIIIPAYNQVNLLKKCLRSLFSKTRYRSYRVYLVDDSGTKKIGNEIKKHFSKVRLIFQDSNQGFSKACNRGMKTAIREYEPDYLLLLNDDTEIVDPDWLEKMVEVSETNKKIGILGCKIVYPDGTVQWVKNYKGTKKIMDVKDVIGACFLIKKRVLKEIGFLDEGFSPAYGEESDFCFRARKKGFRLIYFSGTKVIHQGSATTKTLDSDGIWYIKKRHAIRLEWLNHSLPSIVRYSLVHLISAITGKSPFTKIKLLLKAYRENLGNLKEIKHKRKERNSWGK